MAQIIPSIHKRKLPKELHYPVKYSDIEACFLENPSDLWLDVFCWWSQAVGRRFRGDFQPEDEYPLLILSYDPDYQGFPWQDLANGYRVQATVGAVPRKVSAAVGLVRPVLQSTLANQVRKLIPRGIPCDRWQLHGNLLTRQRALEWEATPWMGIRKEPTTRLLVSLEQKQETESQS
jgi:hypothetical protein